MNPQALFWLAAAAFVIILCLIATGAIPNPF